MIEYKDFQKYKELYVYLGEEDFIFEKDVFEKLNNLKEENVNIILNNLSYENEKEFDNFINKAILKEKLEAKEKEETYKKEKVRKI